MTGLYDGLANSLTATDKHTSRVAIVTTDFQNVCLVYENGRYGIEFASLSQMSDALSCDAIKTLDNGVYRKDRGTEAYQPAACWEHVNVRSGVRRAVQIISQDGRWRFEEHGAILDYEAPENYSARRKADRINGKIIAEYLGRMGIPVLDDSLQPIGNELYWTRIRAG